jgi:hypothetical protein
MEMSPVCKILAYDLRSGPLNEQGGDHHRATPTVDTGPPVSFEGLPHSVASYDTHGDAGDLF